MAKQPLAIAVCRVSSLEQLQSNSLGNQKDNVLKAAETLGVTIPEDGLWEGQVSSKIGVNYDRKDLKEMFEYCKRHSDVKYLIVQEVDRFMRSPDEQVYFQVKFWYELKVKIWYADKPELNKDDIYSGLMRYMEGFRAAGSNVERQTKSITGQTKALQQGRYPFHPKPGYQKGYDAGIPEIHPVRGPILKATLLDIANRRFDPTQALIHFNKTDFTRDHSPYKMDKFRHIITDPFYAGIVEIDKQVKVRNENGLHEPLITKEQHYELCRIMSDKKKTQAGPRKNGNPKYPCNNIVECDMCTEAKNGRAVGYDLTNGKSSKIYEKYRCRACGRLTTRQIMHEEIERNFKENPISKDGINDLVEALAIVWKQREGQAEQDIARIKAKINIIEENIAQQVEAATDPSNASIKAEILALIAKRKQEIKDLEGELLDIKSEADDDQEEFLRFAYGFVENMGSQFLELEEVERNKCKQIVFPAGFLWNSENKVYTPEVSPLIRLATKKKSTEVLDNSLMVHDS